MPHVCCTHIGCQCQQHQTYPQAELYRYITQECLGSAVEYSLLLRVRKSTGDRLQHLFQVSARLHYYGGSIFPVVTSITLPVHVICTLSMHRMNARTQKVAKEDSSSAGVQSSVMCCGRK